jgi:hypothetical protein
MILPNVFHLSLFLQITIATGSDYICTWNFGDGSAPYTTDPITTPTSAGTPISHTYATVGTKNVLVSCRNDVSMVNAMHTQIVQERITGLTLSALGQDSQNPFVVPWQVRASFRYRKWKLVHSRTLVWNMFFLLQLALWNMIAL